MIFVSSCLLGKNCKYNGGNNKNEAVISFLKDKEYRGVCPESYGNLPCPRLPSEIRGESVVNAQGEDVTKEFVLGADILLQMAKKDKPTLCILKESSPSCGVHTIYDGTFSKRKIGGMGLSAKVLQDHGFAVLSEKDIEAKK